ncbi:MAG: hypothetical protein ACXWLW_07505, partial [Rhizomicrobium sp.]
MVDLLSSFWRFGPRKQRGPVLDSRWRIDLSTLGGFVGKFGVIRMNLPRPKARAPVKPKPTLVKTTPRPVAPTAAPAKPKVSVSNIRRFKEGEDFLAVHGVEKSFGNRKVVKGVSL